MASRFLQSCSASLLCSLPFPSISSQHSIRAWTQPNLSVILSLFLSIAYCMLAQPLSLPACFCAGMSVSMGQGTSTPLAAKALKFLWASSSLDFWGSHFRRRTRSVLQMGDIGIVPPCPYIRGAQFFSTWFCVSHATMSSPNQEHFLALVALTLGCDPLGSAHSNV